MFFGCVWEKKTEKKEKEKKENKKLMVGEWCMGRGGNNNNGE